MAVSNVRNGQSQQKGPLKMVNILHLNRRVVSYLTRNILDSLHSTGEHQVNHIKFTGQIDYKLSVADELVILYDASKRIIDSISRIKTQGLGTPIIALGKRSLKHKCLQAGAIIFIATEDVDEITKLDERISHVLFFEEANERRVYVGKTTIDIANGALICRKKTQNIPMMHRPALKLLVTLCRNHKIRPSGIMPTELLITLMSSPQQALAISDLRTMKSRASQLLQSVNSDLEIVEEPNVGYRLQPKAK